MLFRQHLFQLLWVNSRPILRNLQVDVEKHRSECRKNNVVVSLPKTTFSLHQDLLAAFLFFYIKCFKNVWLKNLFKCHKQEKQLLEWLTNRDQLLFSSLLMQIISNFHILQQIDQIMSVTKAVLPNLGGILL